MKMMRKSRLSQALAAAVFAAGLSATAVMPTSVQAAPTNNPHGIGDVLLFPYYTTENGFLTLVHLVNNDPDRTVLAKIRFREFKNSTDVLDFNIILSPNDVFSGYLRSTADDVLEFVKTDNTCTSPHRVGDTDENGDGVNEGAGGILSFGNNAGLDTTHTGHIEVLTMGVIENSAVQGLGDAAENVADGALHDSMGIPADCATVDTQFTVRNTDDLQMAVTDFAAGTDTDGVEGNENASVNALSGHYVLLKSAEGIAAGGRPLVIQDATTPNTSDVTADFQSAMYPGDPIINPCGGPNGNLICAQDSAQFFAPSMANLNGITADCDGDDGTVCADNVARFQDLERAINGALGETMVGANDPTNNGTRTASGSNNSVQNEWTGRNFATSGKTASEIVLTLPVKHVYKDDEVVAVGNVRSRDIFASRDGGETYTPWDAVDNALRPNDPLFIDGTSADDPSMGCVRYERSLVNREESRTTASTSESGPTAPINRQFCNETQVFTFNGGVSAPGNGASSDVDLNNELYGWFDIELLNQGGGSLSQAVANTGISFWQRNFGSADRNYGHIMDNTRRSLD